MLRYLAPSRTRNVSRFRFGLGHAKVLLERETGRYLTPSRTRFVSRFRCDTTGRAASHPGERARGRTRGLSGLQLLHRSRPIVFQQPR